MSVLIKGIKMPPEGSWKTVRIYPDGACAIPNWQGDCPFLKEVQAVELPPHGRSIDADAFIRQLNDGLPDSIQNLITYRISKMPTIIEAEESE